MFLFKLKSQKYVKSINSQIMGYFIIILAINTHKCMYFNIKYY